MAKNLRTGAVGAILDIYEDAIFNFKRTIETIPDDQLTIKLRSAAPECQSIQAILSHVVHSAFGYATSIHNSMGNGLIRPDKTFHLSIQKYLNDLDNVFSYTENIFSAITDDDLEELDFSLKIKTGWGQFYDIEQLMEHAIVHLLRHQRQLENVIHG